MKGALRYMEILGSTIIGPLVNLRASEEKKDCKRLDEEYTRWMKKWEKAENEFFTALKELP